MFVPSDSLSEENEEDDTPEGSLPQVISIFSLAFYIHDPSMVSFSGKVLLTEWCWWRWHTLVLEWLPLLSFCCNFHSNKSFIKLHGQETKWIPLNKSRVVSITREDDLQGSQLSISSLKKDKCDQWSGFSTCHEMTSQRLEDEWQTGRWIRKSALPGHHLIVQDSIVSSSVHPLSWEVTGIVVSKQE